MTERLLKWQRETLEAKLLEHAYRQRCLEHFAEWRAFAADVFNDVYDPVMQLRMDELPEGWLPLSSTVCVAFGDGNRAVVSLQLAGNQQAYQLKAALGANYHSVMEDVKRRVPYQHDRGCVKRYEVKHKLARRYEELDAAHRELNKQIEESGNKIRAALHSYTTLGALLKGWPEIEPFTRGWKLPPSALPAVQVFTLNKTLGLPVEEELVA